MKTAYLLIFAISPLILITSCSTKSDGPTEIRFVDLQGNARPIKTRVPEANAKILSGQISPTSNSQEISKEYNYNQNSNNEYSKKQNRDLFTTKQNQSPPPKFSDNEVYKENNMPKVLVENNVPSATENPVIEYDFYEDNSLKNKSNTNKNLTEKSQNFVDDINSNKNKIILDENIENQNSKTTNTQNNSVDNSVNPSRATSKSNKIITYSSKNVKKTNSKGLSQEDFSESNSEKSSLDSSLDSSSENIEIVDESSEKSYAKYAQKGKFYVQVGSFLNSQGAKEKINNITNFKNGKVLIAYKDNKRIYRSVYGPYKNRVQADKIKNKISQSGIEAIVIRGK